ncbi:MAG: hypothetical protein ACFB00_01310 [Parvularculaceae bacterium]
MIDAILEFVREASFASPLGPGEMAALGLAAAVAIGLALWRAPAAGALRLVALAALIALVAEPQRRVADETPLDDVALVLIDDSASVALDDRAAARDEILENLRARLDRVGGLEVIESAVEGDEETRYGEAIAGALGDAPRRRLAAVFVVGDGRSNDAIDATRLPRDAPVHFLSIGRRDEFDRKITLIDAPRYGVVNEEVTVSFRIDDVGPDDAPVAGDAGAPRQASVRLSVDGEEIVEQPVPVGVEVSFAAPLARPGEVVIELEAAALDGELTTRNNLAVLPISAIRDRLRVLLISGEPHAGERVWRNLLKSDPAIDLVHFTILRPSEKQASDGVIDPRELALIEFPYDELFIEKLAEFDLVIFDRYTYRNVLRSYHFENIARYVENGGAVLVSSGPEFAGPLSLAERRNFAYILPVTPTDLAREAPYRPKLTDAGERHPVTANLPEADYWGRWMRLMPTRANGGRVLMAGPNDEPLLVLDRTGEGRVGVMLSDHVWLWARGFDGGGPHAELLRRVAHWLMKEPELEEERLALREEGGDLVIERRTIEREVAPVDYVGPDGATGEIELEAVDDRLWRARLAAPPRGLYRARSGDLFAVGAVGLAAPPELADVTMARGTIAEASAAAGGGVFDAREDGVPALRTVGARARERSGGDWAGIVRRDARRVEAVRAAPLAPPSVWLAIVALCLVAAWAAESGRVRSLRGE